MDCLVLIWVGNLVDCNDSVSDPTILAIVIVMTMRYAIASSGAVCGQGYNNAIKGNSSPVASILILARAETH